MIEIKINGLKYTNIASITPACIYDYYYSVKTMDGKMHRETKGKRTNYNILFYNADFKQYDELKAMLLSTENVVLEVPNGERSTTIGEYLVTVNGDELKGLLWGGEYYNTALSVSFERIGYDE